MGTKIGVLASAVTVLGLGSALVVAPTASALPQCVTTAPWTTQCTTGGSNQIITSPPLVPSNNYGWPVLGNWGPTIIIGR